MRRSGDSLERRSFGSFVPAEGIRLRSERSFIGEPCARAVRAVRERCRVLVSPAVARLMAEKCRDEMNERKTD